MISDRAIWRTAHAMVEQFSDDAGIRAATRVDALLAEGDLDGHQVWKRVFAVIIEIRSCAMPGERVN